jgi:general stress protein 26
MRKIEIACQKLMTKPELVNWATIDRNGYPQMRVIANMRNHSLYPGLKSFFNNQPDYRIYLTTHSRSKKIGQIKNNSKASVYFIMADEFHSLLLLGDLLRIKEGSVKEKLWQVDWEQFYKGGPTGPNFAVFQMDPVFGKGWFKNKPFSFKITK